MTQKSRDSSSCLYNYLPLLRADPASKVSYEMHIKYFTFMWPSIVTNFFG
jgi:hypothetical protein